MSLDTSQWDKHATDLSVVAPERIRKAAGVIVRKSTLDTQRDGMAETPVVTGNLRGSWTSDFIGSNGFVATGETGPTAEYAEYVNDGTSRQAPNDFVGRAVARNEGQFATAVEAIGAVIQ